VAIAFIGAGSGVERLTAGTSTVSKATCTAGNFVIIQSFFGADTGDGGLTNFSNIETLDGIGSDITDIVNAANRQVFIGRVTANGTCSADLLIGASGDDGAARIYEFSGINTSTVLTNVVENGAGTNNELGFSASTSVVAPDVVTNGANRFGLCFVGLRSNQATVSFTGESGGDWTELVSEYNGTVLTLQLQSAVLASAGTITGGNMTVSSTYWISTGLALIPAVAAGPSSGQRMMTLGTG
jgi:hypothetical protein